MELARSTGLIALTRHGRIKASLINVEFALTTNVCRQIQWETIGVMQLERDITIQHTLFR